jgi:hypothetical protein
MQEILHEEFQVHRPPDHGAVEARRRQPGRPSVSRETGLSTATFYKWRAESGGMDVSMMARIKQMEDENRRLKKIYLDQKLKTTIVTQAWAAAGSIATVRPRSVSSARFAAAG